MNTVRLTKRLPRSAFKNHAAAVATGLLIMAAITGFIYLGVVCPALYLGAFVLFCCWMIGSAVRGTL
jgi:hypothetical protein